MKHNLCHKCGINPTLLANSFCSTDCKVSFISGTGNPVPMPIGAESLTKEHLEAIKNIGIPEKRVGPVNRYEREIKPGVWVDYYDIARAYELHDAPMAHALKKMLAIGNRGHKDEAQDRKDIFDSVVRSNQQFEEWK